MRTTLMMGILLAASPALAGGHQGGSAGGHGGGGARAPSHGAPPPSHSGGSVSPSRGPSVSTRLQPSTGYPSRPYGPGRGYAAPYYYVAPLPYYGSYYYDDGLAPPAVYPPNESGPSDFVTQPAEIPPPPPPNSAPPDSVGPSPDTTAPPPPNQPPPPPPNASAPNASESMGARSDISEDVSPGPPVYHWVDDEGVDNYSTNVPPEYRGKASKIGGQLSGIVWSAPSTK